MKYLADFFETHIIEIYFLNGLAFFSMGLAILLESVRPSRLDLARSINLLAGFGFLHSFQIWFEMLLLFRNPEVFKAPPEWLLILHLSWLVLSFLILVAFGARLIAGPDQANRMLMMMLTVIAIWGFGLLWVLVVRPVSQDPFISADAYTRYALAIPGTVLTAWGLKMQYHRLQDEGITRYGGDITRAAIAIALYGVIGQLLTDPSGFFPAADFQTGILSRWFGLPIQVFRAVTATATAFFIIRSLRTFEIENQMHIEELRQARIAERQKLETTRAELLHRTVKAQESERQRIAQELHDDTGQTLTALGLGLRGLSGGIHSHPQKALLQARQLEKLAVEGLENLQRLVTGLRPPQLDDLGLSSALRWLSKDIHQLNDIQIITSFKGDDKHLSPDQKSVFFRIAQEALTNAVRHSQATSISITLDFSANETILTVKDNGCGFDINQLLDPDCENHCWGLLGMQERAVLIGADLKIISNPGQGTSVELRLIKEPDNNGAY